MIIDFHTHFVDYDTEFSDELKKDMARCHIKPEQWRFTEKEYIDATAQADRAVVFGIRAKATGWNCDNERVFNFTQRNPKYIFFASIDPLDQDYMEQLRYCHKILKCKGIKLGPIYQGVHPCDKRYYEIYSYCEKEGLPIVNHMATTFTTRVPLEYARPIHMDTVAVDFPDLKMIIAHLAHPWEGECIAAIRRHPNLYADLSALYYRPFQFYHTMRLVEEYGVSEKVIFGSDYPATTTLQSIEGIRNINQMVENSSFPQISHNMIEEIIHRNSLKLFDIQ